MFAFTAGFATFFGAGNVPLPEIFFFPASPTIPTLLTTTFGAGVNAPPTAVPIPSAIPPTAEPTPCAAPPAAAPAPFSAPPIALPNRPPPKKIALPITAATITVYSLSLVFVLRDDSLTCRHICLSHKVSNFQSL